MSFFMLYAFFLAPTSWPLHLIYYSLSKQTTHACTHKQNEAHHRIYSWRFWAGAWGACRGWLRIGWGRPVLKSCDVYEVQPKNKENRNKLRIKEIITEKNDASFLLYFYLYFWLTLNWSSVLISGKVGRSDALCFQHLAMIVCKQEKKHIQ